MKQIRGLMNTLRDRLGECAQIPDGESASPEGEGKNLERRPSVFEQTTDLRKEMEMTEHHETCAEVADRFSTSTTDGLSASDARIVSQILLLEGTPHTVCIRH